MRRLRSTDGSPAHRKAARYHLGRLARGGAKVHADLKSEMAPKYATLKAAIRATDDAEDDVVEASALSDAAEIDFENVIRDVDADLGKLDREKPDLNARATIFPDGYGSEIDPEGSAQLADLPALRKRFELFSSHATVAAGLARFDAAVTALTDALGNETNASAKLDVAFQAEQDARREIREQLESAYGRLRDFYKAKPIRTEEFFLKEGRRSINKNDPPADTKTP